MLGSFFLDPGDHIGAERLIMGDWYEGRLLSMLAALFERLELESGTALDVGANIGNHARFFVSRFRHLICVEPGTVASSILRANLELSGRRNYEIHRVALGRVGGVGVLDRIDLENLGSSVVRSVEDEGDFEIVQGDSLLDRLGVDDLTFVKIDVEGSEVEVLAGLADTLNRAKPVVGVEVLEERRWQEIARLLRAAGYERWFVFSAERALRGIVGRAWSTLRGQPMALMPLPAEFRDGGYDMILCMTRDQADRIEL